MLLHSDRFFDFSQVHITTHQWAINMNQMVTMQYLHLNIDLEEKARYRLATFGWINHRKDSRGEHV